MNLTPTHTLASTLPPLVTGVAKIMHFGFRYQWSPVFEKWIKTDDFETVRIGETIPDDVAVIDR